jgi:ABC-type multidrug transport system fused ATPase/permease subunit
MDRFEEILRQDSEPLGGDGLPDFPEVKGRISFCSVGFSYPEGFHLTDIDFEVAAGETVAIVGPSGAGKSSLRRQFAWVPQEPVLFYGTLAENLVFSRPGAAWEEILEVAIARALLSGARILILDEPTSALDPESEHMIQDALAGLKGRHTVLIVAHRLSTIRHADRIFVLDNGRLAEQGSHRELLAQKGPYHKLYNYHLF